MKKSVVLLVALTMAFLLGSCAIRARGAEPGKETPQITGSVPVQYIRTDGGQEGAVYPRVRVIPDRGSLEAYYEENRTAYQMERREQVYSDSTVGFLDACDRYDPGFFEENYLVLVLLEEGSGSIRHRVEGISAGADGRISLSVTRLVPEVGTDDMAQWHLILEMKKEGEIPDPGDFTLYVDGALSLDGDGPVAPQTAAEYPAPPEGTLHTPGESISLRAAGYSWFYVRGEQLCAVIADQAGRPLDKSCLEPLEVSGRYAEAVPERQPDGTFRNTEELGYYLKLDWPVCPDEITVTCWKETVWDGKNVREETAAVTDVWGFYAKAGAYVYEITAAWEDRGRGCYGTASYYCWIRTPDHGHQLAEEPQTVKDPYVGYCGNTRTTLYIGEDTYSFMYGNSVTLTDLLLNLDYRRKEVCRCMAEYRVDTEFALGYEVNLTEGFVRCEKGQAKLSREQVEQIREIIEWAVTTDCRYPLDG